MSNQANIHDTATGSGSGAAVPDDGAGRNTTLGAGLVVTGQDAAIGARVPMSGGDHVSMRMAHAGVAGTRHDGIPSHSGEATWLADREGADERAVSASRPTGANTLSGDLVPPATGTAATGSWVASPDASHELSLSFIRYRVEVAAVTAPIRETSATGLNRRTLAHLATAAWRAMPRATA